MKRSAFKAVMGIFASVAAVLSVGAAGADPGAASNELRAGEFDGNLTAEALLSGGQDPLVLYQRLLDFDDRNRALPSRGEFEAAADYASRIDQLRREASDIRSSVGRTYLFRVEFSDYEIYDNGVERWDSYTLFPTFKYDVDRETLKVYAHPSLTREAPIEIVQKTGWGMPALDCFIEGVYKKTPEEAKRIKFNSRYYVVMDLNAALDGAPTIDRFGWRSTYYFGLRKAVDTNRTSSTYGTRIVYFRHTRMNLVVADKIDGTVLMNLPCQ